MGSYVSPVGTTEVLTHSLKRQDRNRTFDQRFPSASLFYFHCCIVYNGRMKTNAVRLLDSMGVPYQLREYEVDPDDLAAETVAAKIKLPAEQVFKTLLARGDRNGPCFAVIPGNSELDYKALAKLSGDRKVEMVQLKEVQPLTGYIRGGVTVLGAKKNYPVYADETIELWEVISISAGARGTQILIGPADYLRVSEATTGAIAREKNS